MRRSGSSSSRVHCGYSLLAQRREVGEIAVQTGVRAPFPWLDVPAPFGFILGARCGGPLSTAAYETMVVAVVVVASIVPLLLPCILPLVLLLLGIAILLHRGLILPLALPQLPPTHRIQRRCVVDQTRVRATSARLDAPTKQRFRRAALPW